MKSAIRIRRRTVTLDTLTFDPHFYLRKLVSLTPYSKKREIERAGRSISLNLQLILLHPAHQSQSDRSLFANAVVIECLTFLLSLSASPQGCSEKRHNLSLERLVSSPSSKRTP